ncbi:uncharacterized protein LOC110117745 [Ceratitis capitata]|uniref:uncharacterized protein LOC110117745 n=1 Tax=Ceratitis capitata TaxID=7213 RepID=UPI000A115360|nr:uncharacterized protein LOC110117745 [Ceratitis capitata]
MANKVKMLSEAFFIIICIFLTMHFADGATKRNYAILLDHVNYTIHRHGLIVVEKFYCGRNIIDLSTFTLHIRMQQNITNFQIKDNFNIIREDNVTVNEATSEITNACDMLSGNYENNLIKLTIIELQQVAKPVILCPLIKNTLYTINNYTLRPSAMPSYLPLMNFIETLQIFMNKILYLDLIFEGRVVKARGNK